jgi:hydroxypyruvate isomerase
MPYERTSGSRKLTRRSLLRYAGGVVPVAALGFPSILTGAPSEEAPPSGAIQQSVCRWCYGKLSLDDLAKEAARIGYKGIDLVGPNDWATVKRHGLVPTMVPGAGSIGSGWNRKENHERLIADMKKNIGLAAEAGLRNVITFSGNRRGLPDDEGAANCAEGLKQVVGFAEEKKINICMELLNSKVNHKDYQCDHTAWGVEVCKKVGSPRMKLLYDIYHMQIMEGDIIRTIRESIDYIGHFHTGGNPGRNEIDETQEIYYPAVMKAIAELKFDGYVAQEFIPKRDPIQSMEQAFRICNV